MGDFFWPTLLGVFFVCWCLGAYNRLRRLRRQALDSTQKLFAQLMEFKPLFDRGTQNMQDPQDGAGRGGGAAALPGWAAVLQSAGQLDAVLQGVSRTSLDSAAIRSTAQALEALQRSWGAVCEAPHDLAGAALPPELHTQWGVLNHRMLAARASANQDLAAYNQAIGQAPVRWLAPVVPFAAVAYF